MLPDFRFVLGAILAIALLAVAGLGLVTSVKLAQEARMNPIEDARSLAFAGHAQWNQFYDPDGARRFEGLGGKAPATEARLEAPAEISEIAPPVAAPVLAPAVIPQEAPQEQTASIPVDAPSIADDKPPASDPPRTDPPQLPETAAAVTIAVPPAEVVGALASEALAPPGAGAPSAERVASAPTMVPGLGLRQKPLAEPQAEPPTEPPAKQRPEVQAPAETEATVDPLQNPPTPRVRPKPLFHRRIVRAQIHRVAPVSQQTTQNSGFPPSPPWPNYDNQFTGATTTKKNAGRLTGTLTNRPQ
jgi:hypothetical protein